MMHKFSLLLMATLLTIAHASNGLLAYPPVPGLAASEHYQLRVRDATAASEWASAFAFETKCKDAVNFKAGYFDHLAGWPHTDVNFETSGAVEIEITRVIGQSIKTAVVHPLRKASVCSVNEAVPGNVDMCATIFALSGAPAPEGIDGKSLLPLLANPAGRVRDWLPLFNFWGQQSAQSMAVVSSELKYIYWYYGGGGKKRAKADEVTPIEELFHLAKDRIEMANVAGEEAGAPKPSGEDSSKSSKRDERKMKKAAN